jgi:hypothetical protein
MEISSLPLPPYPEHFLQLCPFCCVLVFSLLFIAQFFWFFVYFTEWGSVCPGAMLVYPKGGWGSNTWCLVLTCLVCHMSPEQVRASVWWRRQPSCFLSVMWHGEAFYRLGVQGVKVFILFGASFLPCVAPVSQQGFDSWSSWCLLLYPVGHLDSLCLLFLRITE